MKLLCVGDVHLGRQPSRLSEEVLERISGQELSPSAAWGHAVKEALRQPVDAVLLAGDVVEQSDDFYEAYADLRAGVQRLTEAGIRVLAVAGNHDVEVLPRLADALADFQLLGRGGAWESAVVHGGDGARARVVGWSFPGQVVSTNPLANGFPDRQSLTTIGLLHCDRDRTGSRYAPVRSCDLEAAPVDAWLLGHIHKPDALVAPRPSGYLGSLAGMDPGESGAHGPWLLEVSSRGIRVQQLPLAPLRWEDIDIALDELGHADDVHARAIDALDALHEDISRWPYKPIAVGCRLRLRGRTGLRLELERALSESDPRERPHERDGILYFVHDWRLEALPATDLQELAGSSDPVGLLARKLIVLRGEDTEERRLLIREAQLRLEGAVRGRHFAALRAEPPDESQTTALLEAAALRALDALLAQQQGEA